MYCPKCGTPAVEGAVFCAHCGYRLPQEPAPAKEPVQEEQQEPVSDYQQEFDRAINQAVKELKEEARQKAEAEKQEEQQAAEFRQAAFQAVPQNPEKEKYFAAAIKVIIIILTALALMYGLIGRAFWDSDPGDTLLWTILPATAMLVTAILMNKVPPVIAIVPVGVEAILNTWDMMKYGDYLESDDRVIYFLFAGFAALFVFQLLKRKKVFKVFAVILVVLYGLHNIGSWCSTLVDEIKWYTEDLFLFEDMMEDGYLKGLISYLNNIILYNLAMILLVLGVKTKKKT